MMKKILHIPNYYPPHKGGIEDVCYNIVSELKSCYLQEVICFNDFSKKQVDCFEKITVTRIGYLKKISSQAISLSYFYELKKKIGTFAPDVIHFHAPNPLVSLYLLSLIKRNTHLVVHWHSDIVDQKQLYRFYAPVERQLLKRAQAIIATSENYLTCSFPLSKFTAKSVVIANMIDTGKLDLQEQEGEDVIVKRIKDAYKGSKLILFIGRMVPYKGLEYLIKAAKEIRGNYKILLVGGGPLEDDLKKMAQDNSNIIFLGRVNDSDLRAYLHASDIFAFPSITKNEAFGIALAEALYCGLPAVCFNVQGSGVSWVNQHNRTGFVVENKSTAQLAEAINVLIQDDSCRMKMSEEAKCWARGNFLRKNAATKISEIYESLNGQL
jgi:glycosyltransferase involved in cell wall biosynthesis